MQSSSCPTDAELSAFAVGELASAAVERLAEHLDGCAKCRDRLAQTDERPDEVVSAIRRGTSQGRVTGGSRSKMLTADAAPVAAQPTEVTDPLSVSELPAVVASASDGTEGPGTRIGPYRLMQLLGEGGFGSVFLAEQTVPVRRQVALKLVKLGMDTRQVLARFQAERQALAMMDHPNIARVLDAGSTDRGRPYFVMELARGVAITEYCDSNHLPARKRLELYGQVCDAVQHAHTKGVIHRDIKPNNVMITMRDGGPVPKIIDFGIAKAIGGRLTDQTLYTEIRHFLGTPEYMSPEQAEGAALEIDSRTDVYSLGVLLYELLTGTTPFDAKALRAKGIDRIGQTIREIDPPKPSTRVGELAQTLPDVAARRGTDAKKLSQSLRGELDWIVMKCLEKDRTLRYATVAALAADVRKYLQDEPISAGPPGLGYQLRKFARRHRAGLLAAATVLVAVGLGISVAISGWGHQNTPAGPDLQAAKAAAEAARAAELANEAKYRAQVDAVFAASPQSVVPLIDSLRATSGGGGVEAIRAGLRKRMSAAAPGSPARLRASICLTLFGEPLLDDLVKVVATAPPSEGLLIAAAMAASAPEAKPPQTRPAGEALAKLNALANAPDTGVRLQARCATIALFLGDDAPAERMLAIAPDPTPHYAFLTEFAQWHGDLAQLPRVLGKVTAEARCGLCTAVGRLKPADLPDTTREALTKSLVELYVNDPSGPVHMACGYALRQWQVELPAAMSPAMEGDKPRGWFVGKSQLTMVRVPAGFTVNGDDRDGFHSIPVLFTRPLYASATEVPHALFKQFAEDPEVADADRPVGWVKMQAIMQARFKIRAGPSDAAVGMTLLEAARFCNWLSVKEGRLPCYSFEGDKPEQWRIDPAADGFRVPTSVEWEYFARAGSTLRYPCSDDGEYLDEIIVSMSVGSAAGRFVNVQPNRWGLVNTIGGVAEMCWLVDLLRQPDQQRSAGIHAVVDPRAVDGGARVVVRGGVVGNEMRSANLIHVLHSESDHTRGFRVVCAASAAGAPPEIAAPEDHGELWMWAAKMRPQSTILATRAAQWITAYAQVYGRARDLKRAADAFQKGAELQGDDLIYWWYAATLYLQVGDRAAHRAACEQMLRILSAKETAGQCDRTAKAMLLDPQISAKDLAIASEKAARALELVGESPSQRGEFLLVTGMADYRNGRFASAIERLDQAREALPDRGGRVSIDLFRAMALHRAGRRDEAQKALNDAKAVLDEVAPLDATDWTVEWINWTMGRFTLQEAERVMKL